MESFNSRFRDELLNIELFTSVQEAKLLAEQHRTEYNTYRPHSALQGRTPLEVLQPVKRPDYPPAFRRTGPAKGARQLRLDPAVPGQDKTAKNGKWQPSPGRSLLNKLKQDGKGALPLIAEDLGVITPDV